MKTYIYDLNLKLVAEGDRDILANHEDQFLEEDLIVARQKLEPVEPVIRFFKPLTGDFDIQVNFLPDHWNPAYRNDIPKKYKHFVKCDDECPLCAAGHKPTKY